MRRLRGEPGDVNVILPFEEVIAALGRTGEHRLGLQVIPLDSIVGTVDRTREFDRQFRPTTGRVRGRWERVAAAMRRGESLPPIDVYRIGELHFVRDGHHRVSVARALGRSDIDAYVTAVETRVPIESGLRPSDLFCKDHERLFYERVPLPPAARERIRLSDPLDYASLAEGVEAWGMRAMQDRHAFMDRAQVAREWYDHEYLPVVDAPARRRTARPGDRGRLLPAPQLRALPPAPHPRVERRGDRDARPVSRPGADRCWRRTGGP